MMTDIWQRTRLLLGAPGIHNLEQARILLVGLGGVGSFAAEALTRAGIGHIDIMDSDRVEPTNLNRQLPALYSSLGEYKTRIMAMRMQDINPSLVLTEYNFRYNAESSPRVFQKTYDYVLDAIDSLPDKIHLIKTCLDRGIPLISCMGAANRLNPQQFAVADIKDTSVCPMARRVRRQLRQEGISSGLKVVYSMEPPQRLDDHPQALGSLVCVTASAGLLLACHAIQRIAAGNS